MPWIVTLAAALDPVLEPGAGSPKDAGAIPALTVFVAIIVLGSIAHVFLRWADQRGWIRYRGFRFRRGVGGALGTLNSILQPHHAAPENLIVHVDQDHDDEGDGRDPPDQSPGDADRSPASPDQTTGSS